MRLGEECPYITPCGWCSRQGKPCEKRPRKPVGQSTVRTVLDEMVNGGAVNILEDVKKGVLAAEEKEG